MDALGTFLQLLVSFFMQFVVAVIGFFIVLARLAIDFIQSLAGLLHL